MHGARGARVADVRPVERIIARCRVVLSIAAFVTVYIDPTRPTLTRWIPLTGGPFTLDPWAVAVMVAHLVYSVATDVTLRSRLVDATRIATVSTWADVLFGAAIALVTEGANSPFYVFFAFAVLAAGFRGGLRPTMRVTAVGVALYVSLILVTHPDGMAFYVMRPAYLTITGYLVGYLGEQRRRVEARLREVEAASERERIARSLHDDYVQALAGVNVRLATCRELLRRGSSGQALAELTELQAGVNREHDDLRTYIRSLLDLGGATKPRVFDERTRFTVRAAFDGSLSVVEHVLQVMLEGARNVARHARASTAAIRVDAADGKLVVAIDDDGVGFAPGAARPWSIASRAAELGGTVRVSGPERPGGHVEIELREA